MPELPEVETMRRGILSIVGSRIEDVRAAACDQAADSDRAARPPRFAAARWAAKSPKSSASANGSWCGSTRCDALVFEPRMTGLVLLAAPPTNEHLRLRIALAGGPNEACCFGTAAAWGWCGW